jgi:colanic acid/amylovoran biosynthesis protein
MYKDNLRTKIALLGASFETSNLGVNALACGTIAGLLQSGKLIDLSILEYSKTPKTYSLTLESIDLKIPLNNIRFSWRIWLPNNIVRLIIEAFVCRVFQWVSLKWPAGKVLRKIQEVDIFLAICGGDSFSDIYGSRRFIYVALPIILAIALGKKMILLPQTYGPFKNKVIELVALYIVNNASMVLTRDATISEEMQLFFRKCRNREIFCPDVAFLLPSKQKSLELPSHSLLFGINVSGLLFMGGYTRNNSFSLIVDYKKIIMMTIEYFIDNGSLVLFIPHVFGNSSKSESDTAAFDTIINEMPEKFKTRIVYSNQSYSEQEAKYLIGQCSFFVGSRMHACIAALSQAIPAIGISYSDKFCGVFASIKCADLVCDARKQSERQILEHIAVCFKMRESIKNRLIERIPDIKERVAGTFRKILNNK